MRTESLEAPTNEQKAAFRSAVLARQHPAHALPPPWFLRELMRKHRDPGMLAWLAAYDPAEAVRDEAMLLLVVAAQDPNVPKTLRLRVLRASKTWLAAAMRDPAVADARKLVLGPLLAQLG